MVNNLLLEFILAIPGNYSSKYTKALAINTAVAIRRHDYCQPGQYWLGAIWQVPCSSMAPPRPLPAAAARAAHCAPFTPF
jgi:hypothetical protein